MVKYYNIDLINRTQVHVIRPIHHQISELLPTHKTQENQNKPNVGQIWKSLANLIYYFIWIRKHRQRTASHTIHLPTWLQLNFTVFMNAYTWKNHHSGPLTQGVDKASEPYSPTHKTFPRLFKHNLIYKKIEAG